MFEAPSSRETIPRRAASVKSLPNPRKHPNVCAGASATVIGSRLRVSGPRSWLVLSRAMVGSWVGHIARTRRPVGCRITPGDDGGISSSDGTGPTLDCGGIALAVIWRGRAVDPGWGPDASRPPLAMALAGRTQHGEWDVPSQPQVHREPHRPWGRVERGPHLLALAPCDATGRRKGRPGRPPTAQPQLLRTVTMGTFARAHAPRWRNRQTRRS